MKELYNLKWLFFISDKRLLVGPVTSPSPIHTKVAFFAKRTTPATNVGNFQAIAFDQVKVNLGNAYSGINGEFIAPTDAIYVFSWTASNQDASHMQTELAVNGQNYARTWTDSGNHNDYSVASITAVADLQMGDKVWVRSADIHSGQLSCNTNSVCTFTGFLLYETGQ